MQAFKLFRQRANGTIGPLFINRKQIVPTGEWLPAESHPTKGFAVRPGWHVLCAPEAPHLSNKGRVWMRVEVENFQEFHRPASQGGKWLLAEKMRVLGPVEA